MSKFWTSLASPSCDPAHHFPPPPSPSRSSVSSSTTAWSPLSLSPSSPNSSNRPSRNSSSFSTSLAGLPPTAFYLPLRQKLLLPISTHLPNLQYLEVGQDGAEALPDLTGLAHLEHLVWSDYQCVRRPRIPYQVKVVEWRCGAVGILEAALELVQKLKDTPRGRLGRTEAA